MASNPVDPLQTLQAALTVQPNSQEQADILASLREALEQQPAPITVLAGTLIGFVVNAGDSLLKTWVIDLLHFAICRAPLSLEQRTQLGSQTLDTLAQLLDDPNPAIVKVVVSCLTTVYPLLFRLLCTNHSNPAAWNTLSTCKARIIEFVWAPTTSSGVRLSSIKFLQRIILLQTRGISDPRLQNKNDPSISSCPANHPFISAAKLETEGQQLLEAVIALLYTSQNTDLITAMLNSWANLTKLRPAVVPAVLVAVRAWTPETSAINGIPASSIKSVEKALRILLHHISRVPSNAHYAPQIQEFMARQAVRMDEAAAEEKKRKTLLASGIDSRKRPAPASTDRPSDPKRPKLEPDASATSASFLATFDFTSLPAPLITDLIVANIEAFSENVLIALVETYRQSRGLPAPAAAAPQAAAPAIPTAPRAARAIPTAPAAARASTPEVQPPASAAPVVKDEPVDPLQMVIDQDELEYEPDKLNEELSGDDGLGSGGSGAIDIDSVLANNMQLLDFKLPPPKALSDEESATLVRNSVARIWNGSEDLKSNGEALPPDSSQAGGHSPAEMWMLLLVRLVTRVVDPPPSPDEGDDNVVNEFYDRQDRLRQTLCDYIMSDFPARIRLATTWMNEEWYNDRIQLEADPDWRPNYDTWLNQIVASYQTLLDGKDRTFSRFLLDLPAVPEDVLGLLRELCVDANSPDRMQTKKTRGAAINTVKTWVPNAQPMDGMVREFALQMLRKLQLQADPKAARANGTNDVSMGEDGEDENMEDGQLPPEELVQTPYLPERIELPAQESHVLQHVELLFALCVKVPEFLDEIFNSYPHMDITVQEAIQKLITALIRSLGSSHGKLLTLMRHCPHGAESLALRILTIFTEHGRPSAQLVALVKSLINERDLDARFLIPIIAEMDKPDIIRHLPKIVSILNGEAENKNLVRSVFSSIVTTPPQTFGSVTSNLPRVRQSELLTPAELMVLLHDAEKEIGLQSAKEAITVCFQMTDVFRSEILAVVMQQIMDEPVLPVLFLRTVIQAVTTYKSLVGFVSTTLLSRLITKKIWTNPRLWEGFIMCAKVIAPASFGALLQLPKDQLRELVDKQPSLKSGLRDYVTKKAANKARVAGFLDIFADSEDATPTPASTPTPQSEIPQPEPLAEPPTPHLRKAVEDMPVPESPSKRPTQDESRRPRGQEVANDVDSTHPPSAVDRGRSRVRKPDQPEQQESEHDMKRKGYHALHSSFGKVFHVKKRWKLIREMGSGAYGVVISAGDEITGETVAIKLVSRVFDKIQLAKRALREITLLRHFTGHANITGLIDAKMISPESNEIYIFMEPMEADLHQIIKSGQTLTSEHVQYFVYQILRGMKFVHSANVIHRDLKPGNLLVNADCELKICDFGLSRGFENASNLTEYVATRWYRAPEIMLGFREYDTAIDVWSVGTILAELLSGQPLFKGKDYGSPEETVLQKIASEKARTYVRSLPISKKKPFTKILPTADLQAIDLLSHMLTFDPDQRLTVAEALEHPWLSGYHEPEEEPECPEVYEKWKAIEELNTLDEFRVALWNEIQDYRREIRGGIDDDDDEFLMDTAEESSAMDVAEGAEVSGGAEVIVEEEEEAAAEASTEPTADATEESELGPKTEPIEPAAESLPPAEKQLSAIPADPVVAYARRSSIMQPTRQGSMYGSPRPMSQHPFEGSDNLAPGMPAADKPLTPTDPVVTYARRSSILQPTRQGSIYGSPRPSSQHLNSFVDSPMVTEPPPGAGAQGSIVFPTQPGYVIPARSRTGSTAGRGEVTRKLLRTLSTVSIHESAEGLAGGLADIAPIGRFIVEDNTSEADAPASEMPRILEDEERKPKKDGAGAFFI
ncbi:Mitogen-activated protein kinase [Mycena sanguinolenta]|uniref:mitogen-activated protein kinase n=1 Tax=Mycena sanguinolenta TaxID=230812 RepID=A0A8H6Z4K8_9AGAR|nr:Mitogen-activated protein kinase [Mycena sanguinolenta]